MKLKKLICLLLAGVMAVSAGLTAASAEPVTEYPPLLAGDADLDGEVSIMDATKIQRTIAELEELDELSRQVAKTEFSAEELTILDATNIQRWLAELYSLSTNEVGIPAFIRQGDSYISILEYYRQEIDKEMETLDYCGVVYVTRNGRVLSANVYDSADLGYTIDTPFPIGSLSKQFCGTAIAILEDRGLLSAEDTLGKYFPEYEIGKDVTLKNVLHMKSGIIDYFDDARPMVDYQISEDFTAEQNKKNIMDFLFTQPLSKTPGYSNSNYFLLAEIVEKVSGMKYSEFVKENIFKPLGMRNSGFYEEMVDDPALAKNRPTNFDPMEPHFPGLTQGAGDIVSCAKDMDKWMTSFRTGALLSDGELKKATASVGNYCYGWSVYSGTLAHLGAIATYLSADLTEPETGYNLFLVSSALDPMKTQNDTTTLLNFVLDTTS